MSLESVRKALPERVKVGGLWYSIEEASDEMDVRGLYGHTDYANLIMKMDTQSAPAKIKQTLVHEIFHAANTLLPSGEGMTETQIHAISQIVFQVFTDNPEVRKFIFEEE